LVSVFHLPIFACVMFVNTWFLFHGVMFHGLYTCFYRHVFTPLHKRSFKGFLLNI
jgi:hypothetical protein